MGHSDSPLYRPCFFHSVKVNKYSQQLPLVLSLSSDQSSMLCIIHELLSNEGQILRKQELNQTYYLAQIPLLHSTFFTLTLISPQTINEIYHWHQLGRGEKRASKDEGISRMEAKSQRAEGISHNWAIRDIVKHKLKTENRNMPFPGDHYLKTLNKN